MKLEAEQFEKLNEILLSAFPKRERLAQMLRFGSNRQLETITGKGNLTNVTFELVQAAEAEKWLPELIECAKKATPNNSELEAFEKEIKAQIGQDDEDDLRELIDQLYTSDARRLGKKEKQKIVSSNLTTHTGTNASE